MRTVLCVVASALVMTAAAAAAGPCDPGAITPVQEVRLYGMVAIEQRVTQGVQTLTMLSGPYGSAEQCEIFRQRYTGDRVKAGDRVVTSTCGEAPPSGSVFAILLRGRPFPVVVFEDGANLMAIGNPQMMPAQLVAICRQIRQQLGRGTCHAPAAGPGK